MMVAATPADVHFFCLRRDYTDTMYVSGSMVLPFTCMDS